MKKPIAAYIPEIVSYAHIEEFADGTFEIVTHRGMMAGESRRPWKGSKRQLGRKLDRTTATAMGISLS